MWKKEEGPEPVPYAPPPAPPRPEPVAPPAPRPTTTSLERATIGRSITIRGDVSGDEDLLIQGRIEGSVDLKQNSVTVGREGEVKADVAGRVITVEGRVEGNLIADEQVILRTTAVLQGNITAPRVILEDGARFRGGVDTGETPQPQPAAARGTAQATKATQATQAAKSSPGAAEPAVPGTPAVADQDKSTSATTGDGAGRKRAEVTA